MSEEAKKETIDTGAEDESPTDTSDLTNGGKEDLTTYTEVDTGAVISVSTDVVTLTAQDKQDDDYVYRTGTTDRAASSFISWISIVSTFIR